MARRSVGPRRSDSLRTYVRSTRIIGGVSVLVLSAAAPFRAVLGAPTHTPRVNAKWRYTVRASDLRGSPIRATITVEVIDPFGGVHPAQYDNTNKNIVNRPFTGVFRDYNQFPPESRGLKLTLRVIVRAEGAKIVLTTGSRRSERAAAGARP
jgi:hypothetical protein